MKPKPADLQLRELYRQEYVAEYERKPLDRLARLMPLVELAASDVVADFGCGNAMLLEFLHNKVSAYHGVDFSEEFIIAAQDRSERLKARHACFEATSIEEFCRQHPATFDKGFAIDLSEHVFDDAWLSIVRAMRESLKPGGRLYLHTPNAEFVVEWAKQRGILRQFPEHVAVRDAHANRALLERGGMRDVRIRYLPHYVPALAWLHRLSGLPVAGRYMRARLFIECCR